ncbi:MAG: hypothetical protein COU29_00720 [Candidatus Magasanikbacteria bacterium CG10_big_fil_rev_8_21_14_0_10_36_32]|uniref:Uncharacterized protein n=1 Tax=Candidatus Magasanikbacteria bacterium CG10_big_fil_rev_8_21_14_0_10_36_32 TaxID=1974646 RepID=A0A2M6W689_9BACT|nr:MAG: hypothetical protein COU29_00720 [Candidatus Magasanikbacteria bacterium CG10_big_fil_rev_8_21_14_0_10_36_32]
MTEQNPFERKNGQQPEHKKPAEVSEPEGEEIELSPDELVEITAEKMEIEAESVVEKSKKEIKRLDKESGLGEPELTEAKKETGVEEETKSFGQKVSEVLKMAKDKIYGLFQSTTEEKPEKEVVFDGVFDPEAELVVIKKLPHQERKQAVEIFKEKLAAQKEGLAKMQTQLIEYVRINPDASFEELVKKAEDLGSPYGMSESQLEITAEVLKAYMEKHKAVRKIRTEYSDDAEIYELLFGQKPKGKVQIVEGPLTLHLRLLDKDDYEHTLRAATDLTHGQQSSDTYIQMMAEKTSGVTLNKVMIPELDGSVIAEKAESEDFNDTAKKIYDHEEQHAMKKFFEEQRNSSNALSEFRASQSDEERENALRHFCRHNRQQIEEKAKDEIMAYFKGSTHSAEQVVGTLTRTQEQGGTYDYFMINKMEEVLSKFLLSKSIDEKYLPMIKKVIHDVFRNEYDNLIKNGVKSFVDLQKSDYSTDKTIALLTHEPLRKWPLVVKRMLESKK